MSITTQAEAIAAIKKHGSLLAASRATGIPETTLRARSRGRPALKKPALLTMDGTRAIPVADDKEVERLTAALAQARGTRTEPIKVAKPAKLGKRELVRVCIPDTHGDHISRPAAAAFLADLKVLDPDEIIMLGDHLDCGGFLAQHHTLGYVAETESTFEADVKACNEFLDQVQANAPRARIFYQSGNHEARCDKWCVTMALRNNRDAQFLLDRFGPIAVLGLKSRGIEYIHHGTRYDGLSIPGTIKRGRCFFTHGIGHGRHATHMHVQRFGASVVHGHTHRAQSSIIRVVEGGVVGAWCPGTLAQLQPLYMHTIPTDWSHGYGVQFVQPSGEFLHINAIICDGKSLMPNMIKGA